MQNAVETHISQERCPSLYSAALGLIDGAEVWDVKISRTGGTVRGDYSSVTKQMHIWEGNFASPDDWLPWTLAHEAAHAIGNVAEIDADRIGDSCLTFQMRH